MATAMDDARRISATARVTVTVEIDARGSWGGDCSLAQIEAQAAEGALAFLRALPPGRLRVVGTPRVTAVLVRRDD